MSSFTRASLFMPVVTGPRAGHWRAGQAFDFFERGDMTGPSIKIALLDESNGADIPPAWAVFLGVAILSSLFLPLRTACVLGLIFAALVAWLLPKIHAEYISAVFVHDIGLTKHRHIFSRWRIDKMFLSALRLQRWSLPACPGLDDLRGLFLWALKDLPLWVWRFVRPYLIFTGVSLWGILKERRQYFRPSPINQQSH